MKPTAEKTRNRFLSLGAALALSVFVFSAYVSYALFSDAASPTGEYPGVVALRSYFQKGSGTLANPFVISRPIHFYNLTRLQNLGVFSSDSYYFSLGYDPDHPNDPYASDSATNLLFYPDNATTDKTKMINYLDLSQAGNLLSIGNEGAPFYGTFNGNGKKIYGLHVKSDPEDVGVFGYTYSGSVVKNVYFNNLTITDNGYDSNVTTLATLYGESVEQPVVNYVLNGVSTPLQNDVDSASASFSDLSGSFNVVLPTSYSDVTYEFRASSEYFTSASATSIQINSGNDNESTHYYCIGNNAAFIASSGTQLATRLSVVAKVYHEGLFYSKVIASYRVTFYNTLSDGTSSIHMVAVKDYVNPELTSDSTYTCYAHGTNIGYLIGHCDGSLNNCYVFGGSLLMNNPTSEETTIVRVKQETATGLIGEVGCSLDNEFTPQVAYEQSGDTGVVNFTKMYNDIRGSDVSGSYVNEHGGYYTFTPVAGTADKFLAYLRTDLKNNPSYVTGAAASVDFQGRQVIADTPASDGVAKINRNLGVFSLVSSDWDNTDSSTFYQGLGDYAVTRESTEKSAFYYTTAEYQDLAGTGESVDSWSYALNANNHIERPETLPSYSDEKTWTPSLERYFNYNFRCELGSDAAISRNYFFNTNSGFLQRYFSYKLVSKTGTSVAVGSKNFGVFVKNVDLDAKTTTNIESFDSSLKMSAPNLTGNQNDTIPTITLNSTLYPTKTIDFSIKNANGANVTVIAGSKSGSGGYLGIYDKTVSLNTTYNVAGNYANRHPAYAMYLPYTTNSDDFSYFNYAYQTGATDTSCTVGSSADLLFAHTFKLPQGDYYIASPFADTYVYYVCAQGQNNEGNTGNESTVFSTYNAIANVDFISKSSVAADFVLSDDRCWLSFEGNFAATAGNMSVTSSRNNDANQSVITKSDNLTKLLIYNHKNFTVTFNGESSQESFIEYPQ